MVLFEHVWARKSQLDEEFETAREWRDRVERLIDRAKEPEEPDLGAGCEPL